jgi:hypothetical protein
VLGSVAFTPVKSDMLGNVKVFPPFPSSRTVGANMYKKIRDRQLAAPAQSETIQELVLNELKTKKHTATEGLVWLVRYSHFPPLPFRTLLTTLPFRQRIRLHLRRPLPKPSPGLRRGLDLLPRCIRHDPQTPPLLHGEADFQRRDERVSLSEGFL